MVIVPIGGRQEDFPLLRLFLSIQVESYWTNFQLWLTGTVPNRGQPPEEPGRSFLKLSFTKVQGLPAFIILGCGTLMSSHVRAERFLHVRLRRLLH